MFGIMDSTSHSKFQHNKVQSGSQYGLIQEDIWIPTDIIIIYKALKSLFFLVVKMQSDASYH